MAPSVRHDQSWDPAALGGCLPLGQTAPGRLPGQRSTHPAASHTGLLISLPSRRLGPEGNLAE